MTFDWLFDTADDRELPEGTAILMGATLSLTLRNISEEHLNIKLLLFQMSTANVSLLIAVLLN